jgi:GWxTD domain-containing protein
MRRPVLVLLVLAAALAVLPAGGCRLLRLEAKLSPADADFFDKVRYIITREERKIFLELPDAEKAGYIEEFWKRRDPDPTTEENEYRDEYYRRIEQANKLFHGEGRAGWLTDRGRILVLFGPPTDRITDPGGAGSGNNCQEIWYYGGFPVVFVDEVCTGHYRLVTYDLTGIAQLNLEYMHTLVSAQADAQKTFADPDKKMFDFDARLEIVARGPGRISARAVLRVPYERLWLTSQGTDLATTLQVTLELRNAGKALVWTSSGTSAVRIPESELTGKRNKTHDITLPIEIVDPDVIGRIGGEGATLTVTLVNTTGKESLKKLLVFQ